MKVIGLAISGEFLETASRYASSQDVSLDAVLSTTTEVFRELLARQEPPGTSPGLPEDEQALLIRSGGVDGEALTAAARDVRDGAWSGALLETALLDSAESLSTAQAAEALGVTDSAVRHRLAKRTLWSFPLGRERRLPKWQFVSKEGGDEGQVMALPGLPELIAAIPKSASPSEVNAVMTSPQPGLEIGGHEVTVRTWLLHGHDRADAVRAVQETSTIW